MDPQGIETANGRALEATSAAASEAWEIYYREASRRRHARGGARQLREEKRRRRFRERIGIGISAVIVALMTGAFYLVLTR